jgi:subtilisin family serine protease
VASGFDGEGITIAVLDGFIDTSLPIFADADIETRSFCGYPPDLPGLDPAGLAPGELTPAQVPAGATTMMDLLHHGTSVTALLVGNGAKINGVPGPKGVAPKAKILHYVIDTGSDPKGPGRRAACFDNGERLDTSPHKEAVLAAIEAGADIITTSLGGVLDGEVPLNDYDVIGLQALPNDNEGANAAFRDPYCPGAVYVRGHQPDGELPERLVFAEPFTTVVVPGGTDSGGLYAEPGGSWVVKEMGGNSAATPILAGIMADLMVKYPKATKNQLLQSLVRNTLDINHKPLYDKAWGWGPVEVDHLFSVDPAAYPDVNPLSGKRGELVTTVPSSSPSSLDTSPSPDLNAGQDDGGNNRLWVPVGAALGVSLAVTLTAVFVHTRNKRKEEGIH